MKNPTPRKRRKAHSIGRNAPCEPRSDEDASSAVLANNREGILEDMVQKASKAVESALQKAEGKGDAPKRWTLPAPQDLALIAANVARGGDVPPQAAVGYAFELWMESCRRLESAIDTQEYFASERRKIESIPHPDSFPATLDHFLTSIVKGRTPADSTKRFRDFLRHRVIPLVLDGKSVEEPPVDAKEQEIVEKNLDELMAKYRRKVEDGGGIRLPASWFSLAADYLSWWGSEKSATAKKTAKAAAQNRAKKSLAAAKADSD
jgi:hypothetical protein